MHILEAYETESSAKESLLTVLSDARELRESEALGSLYHKEAYRYLWDQFTIEQLIDASENRDLNYIGKPFHTQQLKQLLGKMQVDRLDSTERAKLDLLASDQFFSYAKFLYEGEIDFRRFSEIIKADEEKHLVWEPNPHKPNYIADLQLALKTHMLKPLLERYVPDEKGFFDLVRAYHRYKALTFPKIDYVKDLKLGDYGYEVSQLKHYLHVTGDLKNVDKSYLDFPTFDKRLQEAVLLFQKRHYLKQNGIFDRVNVLYSKKSAKEKLRMIRLNIERYKLFARVEKPTYIVINIPGFVLQFFKQYELVDEILVVIGREDRPTPIFRDYLEYIVLNPTWSIPQNLMKKDYIPHLVEDPTSLLENDIHIYQGGREIDPTRVDWSKYLDFEGHIPYQMIQKAGEKNVLGAMKFIFPNKYNVYLHDTNAKHLTTRRYRLYSSGCIRLSKPYELLRLLSPYTAYSYARLVSIIESKKTTHVRLKKRVPIHIRYLTVFTDRSGALNFRKDFYGYDAIQLALLED
jgi:murein L,D-transpeptidase YcbB/YkuD